jgi:hypothetical protein
MFKLIADATTVTLSQYEVEGLTIGFLALLTLGLIAGLLHGRTR